MSLVFGIERRVSALFVEVVKPDAMIRALEREYECMTCSTHSLYVGQDLVPEESPDANDSCYEFLVV